MCVCETNLLLGYGRLSYSSVSLFIGNHYEPSILKCLFVCSVCPLINKGIIRSLLRFQCFESWLLAYFTSLCLWKKKELLKLRAELADNYSFIHVNPLCLQLT